ncbi:hypothetical protein V1318_06720 [Lysobacter sp. CCNWLW3]|uniref:hypothetical protein n=1 Tax=unclassified Lysobacter TaxID=2635362 RepID=UPI002FD10C48
MDPGTGRRRGHGLALDRTRYARTGSSQFYTGPYGQHQRGEALALIERCGNDRLYGPAETYAAVIGDHWFVEDRKAWSIVMSSSGEWMDVVTADANPPPPEPLPGAWQFPRELRRHPSRLIVRKSELDDVRATWSAPSLWTAPQRGELCLDCQTVFLEACVHGRCHARSRSCDSAGAEAGMTLWKRLRTHFPDPPPVVLE